MQKWHHMLHNLPAWKLLKDKKKQKQKKKDFLNNTKRNWKYDCDNFIYFLATDCSGCKASNRVSAAESVEPLHQYYRCTAGLCVPSRIANLIDRTRRLSSSSSSCYSPSSISSRSFSWLRSEITGSPFPLLLLRFCWTPQREKGSIRQCQQCSERSQ